MTHDLTASIVRILDTGGDTVGTGFILTQDGLIATCAHVIEGAGARAGDTVGIVMHVTREERRAQVDVDLWRASNAEDIAILQLVGDFPNQAKPLPLGSSDDVANHPFETIGFPPTSPIGGVLGGGQILGKTTLNDVSVLQVRSQEVTGGFSGAPIWDQTTRRVVGMVTATADRDGRWRLAETAFITPTESLRSVCPALRLSDICPYRGLAAFTADDAEFFFGRDTLVADLVTHLRQNPRFLVVVGPSGSGKSSVVQAGLFPALRQSAIPGSTTWRCLTFRPGGDPFAAMSAAGLVHGPEVNLQGAVRTFVDDHAEAERLVIFGDQFEELFALCPEATHVHFMRELLALLESDLTLTVILTLRAGFYGFLLRYAALVDWLKVGQVNVPPMSSAELKAAIEKPAEKVGLGFEPGLVETIVEDASNVDHALPLLESALTQLWQQRVDGVLTQTAYQKIERVTGAIGLWAEDAYSQSNSEEKILVQRVFTRLVHYGAGESSDTRQRRAFDELVTRPKDRETMRRLVRQLADARLLVTDRDPISGEETIEIIHDALLREWGRLQRWLTEQREFFLWRQRLDERLDEWDENDRDVALLLRGPVLAEAERRLAERRDDLTEAERDFVEKSVARRRWTIIGVSGVALLMVLTIIGFAWVQRNQAREKTKLAEAAATAQYEAEVRLREAQARELADFALDELTDPSEPSLDRALLLAREAVSTTWTTDKVVTAQAERVLRQAVGAASPWHMTLSQYAHTGSVEAAAWSPDGERILTASGDIYIQGTVYASGDQIARIWDAKTGQELGRLVGHTAEILSAVWNPDGTRVATASRDGTARIWDAETGQELRQLLGHAAEVLSVSWGPKGERVLTASGDGTARIWDAQTGEELGQLLGHTEWVRSAAWNPDGRRIVTASADGTARVWDAQTRQELFQLRTHTGWVTAAAWSPDGKYIVTGGRDGTAYVWDAQSGQSLYQIKAHTAAVLSTAWRGDGERFVTAGADWSAKIWDARTGQRLGQLLGHTGSVNSAAWSHDGTQIITASGDGSARVWDVQTGQALRKFLGPTNSINATAWSPDGKFIATGSGEDGLYKADWTVRIWDALSGKELRQLLGHRGLVNALAWSPDSERIVTASQDGTARIWNALTSQQLRQLLGHSGPVNSAAWSPDGNRVATASDDGTARIWDAQTGLELRQLDGHTGSVTGVAWSANGKRIVTASDDGTARIWDVETGEELDKLQGHTSKVLSAAWNRDGAYIVTAGADSSAIVWDARTGQELRRLPGHTGPVIAAAWSPGGEQIVTAGEDGIARVWDPRSGSELGRLAGHTAVLTAVAWSPDGGRIVTASADGTARIWDAPPRRKLGRLPGDIASVQALAWSPDGYRVAIGRVLSADWTVDGPRVITSDADRVTRIWDGRTGAELAQLDHGSYARKAAWSPDGRRIATVSWVADTETWTAYIWDAQTGERVSGLVDKTVWVVSAAWSPDGTRLVTSSGIGPLRIWDVQTGEELDELETDARSYSPDNASAAWSPAGVRIVFWNGRVHVWDSQTGDVLDLQEGAYKVVWSPDGKRIVTLGWVADTGTWTASVWDAQTGERLVRLQTEQYPQIASVAWSPDGARLVTVTEDGAARIWDAQTGEERGQLGGKMGDVWSWVAWSPDGAHAITVGGDWTIRIWPAGIDELLGVAKSRIQRDPPVFSSEERLRFLHEGE